MLLSWALYRNYLVGVKKYFDQTILFLHTKTKSINETFKCGHFEVSLYVKYIRVWAVVRLRKRERERVRERERERERERWRESRRSRLSLIGFYITTFARLLTSATHFGRVHQVSMFLLLMSVKLTSYNCTLFLIVAVPP